MSFSVLRFAVSVTLILEPVTAFGQAKTPLIDYLMDRSGPGAFEEAFVRGLSDRGYIVGQNIEIDYRWTDGKAEQRATMAAELVARKVDVIVTAGAAMTLVAKQATTTIPIIMASSQDAVGDGLVASLARPGGNVTGRSVYAPELTGKRLEIVKEVLPVNSRGLAHYGTHSILAALPSSRKQKRLATSSASQSCHLTCTFQTVSTAP